MGSGAAAPFFEPKADWELIDPLVPLADFATKRGRGAEGMVAFAGIVAVMSRVRSLHEKVNV